MGVTHIESGQKADTIFISEKSNLQPVLQNSAVTAGPYNFDFAVPSGKRWVLRAATLERDVSGEMELILVEGVTPIIVLARVDGNILLHQPKRISLPSGWTIRAYYGMAGAGYIDVKILLEEDIEY